MNGPSTQDEQKAHQLTGYFDDEHDTQTRSQLQTSQPFPGVGSQTDGIKANEDGSFDLYFGPKAPEGFEGNWLETIPGKSFFVALRLYGPLEPWIEKTWRPGEIERSDD